MYMSYHVRFDASTSIACEQVLSGIHSCKSYDNSADGVQKNLMQFNQEFRSINITFISGGQTGVDRAVLDIAIKWGLPYRGWCPAGRLAEDGRIPEGYLLRETPTADPMERTIWNIRDSDGLLIFGDLDRSEGTRLARCTAIDLNRPVFHSGFQGQIEPVFHWLQALNGGAVNVAGPRESEQPGVYTQAFRFLDQLAIVSKRKPH